MPFPDGIPKRLGALKAVGYTSGQLIHVLLFQFLSLSILSAIMGAALSYCLFPSVNAIMMAQTGIPYTIHFLPFPFVISFAVLGGAVTFAVWISARKIKRIEPITALRSGIQTHNFKRNYIPLESTKLPLNFALTLKTMFSEVKYNINVCVTMLVLSLVIAFSGVMIENVIKDVTPFLLMVVGETADSCINVKAESEEDFLRELNGDGRVEKAYLYHSLSVSHNGGVELMATLCDDFSKQNNQGVVFKGRFPKYDNEIAIAAKYAKENGLEIGDEIEITANGTQETYLICGYTQISNNLGRDCLMTRRGYERMATLTDASYYINLTEETDIDTFNLEAEEKFDVKVNATVNIDTTIKATTDVYISLMTMIVTAVLALSAIIVVFVLYLLVRTMLNCKIHDYGIMKALGFTTGQLVLQTALSFMPEAILSVEVGLMISSFIINPLTALFLSGIGIVSCTFHVPVGFIVFAAIGLILFAFLTACLLSLRIRKITPKALFSGE